jgi:hypothetical protein
MNHTTRRVHNADFALAEELLDDCPYVSWHWEGDDLILSGRAPDVDRAWRLVRGF